VQKLPSKDPSLAFLVELLKQNLEIFACYVESSKAIVCLACASDPRLFEEQILIDCVLHFVWLLLSFDGLSIAKLVEMMK